MTRRRRAPPFALEGRTRFVAVYCRYGGMADGELIRIDLLDRGLLEVVEKRYSEHHTSREWKSNPIKSLADRWILRMTAPNATTTGPIAISKVPISPFPATDCLTGSCARPSPQAPRGGRSPPAEGAPHAVTRRLPAEVALISPASSPS